MHISEDAKALMDQVLASRDCDSILLDITRQNDQDAISVHVGNSAEFDESMIFFIDGVNVVATDETMDALRNVTFITDDEGRLTILQHGCCGGHGHGHEGGCCGGHGHDHDHEGGCCGGHGHDHDHEGGCCGGHGHDHDHEGGCCGGHGHDHDHEGGCCCHDND